MVCYELCLDLPDCCSVKKTESNTIQYCDYKVDAEVLLQDRGFVANKTIPDFYRQLN